jgi:hypothetical protein
MNSLGWRLAELASLMLESDERTAVCGDLLESGESGPRALYGVMGLVLRRQAALLANWRSLLALTVFVVPFSLLLGLISRMVADHSAIYLWLYFNNWTWTFLENPGARELLTRSLAEMFLQYLTLACCAYSVGYLLNLTARRASYVNAVFFCALLPLEKFVSLPSHTGLMPVMHPGRFFLVNAAVFAVPFYGVMFPLIIQIALVAAPAIWGMRHAGGAPCLSPRVRGLFSMAAGATVVFMALQIWNWVSVASYMHASAPSWILQVLHFIIYWPVLYVIARRLTRIRPAIPIPN